MASGIDRHSCRRADSAVHFQPVNVAVANAYAVFLVSVEHTDNLAEPLTHSDGYSKCHQHTVTNELRDALSIPHWHGIREWNT